MAPDKSKRNDRIFQILVAFIGAAATIYAGYLTSVNITITQAKESIIETATQERLEIDQAPSQTPNYITQLVEVTQEIEVTREVPVTQLVEVTREVTPLPTTPFLAPGQKSIPINYEGKTTRNDFVFKVTTIDITTNGKMRWNIYFWNKTNDTYSIRFYLNNCAYISNRDDGTQYPIKDSSLLNFRDTAYKVQPQTRIDLWFEFDDAISAGAKHLTVNLCPDTFAAYASFTPFDIDLVP